MTKKSDSPAVKTLRVDAQTHQRAREIAAKDCKAISVVIHELVAEAYDRHPELGESAERR